MRIISQAGLLGVKRRHLNRFQSSFSWVTLSMGPKPNQKILWIGLHPFLKPSTVQDSVEWIPDRIIEIAALVTDKDLNKIDSGIEMIVQTDQGVLSRMNEWCIKQHGKTGLTAACLSSDTPMNIVDDRLTEYVRKHFAEDEPALLAGNSVYTDKIFIGKDLPKLASTMHYRILDVSSFKELASRWYPEVIRPNKTESAHRAMSDILDSIEELKLYRQHLFKQ